MRKSLQQRYIEKFGEDLPAFYVIKFKNTKSNRKVIEKAITDNIPLTKMDMIRYMSFDMWNIPEKIDQLPSSLTRKIEEMGALENLTKMDLLGIFDKIDVFNLIRLYSDTFDEDSGVAYGFMPNSIIEVEFLLECLIENHPLSKEQKEMINQVQGDMCDISNRLHIVY